MKPLHTVFAALLMAMALPAPAVQLAGTLPPSHSGPGSADLIERGGTVNAVDPARHTLVVDGAPYTLASGGVRVHLGGSRASGSVAALKPGTHIRFTSVQGGAAPEPQVREIWVTR